MTLRSLSGIQGVEGDGRFALAAFALLLLALLFFGEVFLAVDLEALLATTFFFGFAVASFESAFSDAVDWVVFFRLVAAPLAS